MKNVVFIIAIFFWLWNLIAKSKRKQQQIAQRKTMADVNARVRQRPETAPKEAAPRPRMPAEVEALFQERKAQAPATDYELAYASTDYAPDEKKVEPKASRIEAEPLSHYRKNYGMTKSLGTESAEEKEAYDKDVAVIPKLSLTSGGIRQYIVAAEILGKPKALRGRGSGFGYRSS
jgi:hypothetical protein